MRRVLCNAGSSLLVWCGLMEILAPPSFAQRVYTTDADFDLGTLNNVNHDAPGSDQLQINEAAVTFPFVSVAASARGTAIRIEVNAGAIVGEYLTAPAGMGRDPSRTTVDKFGNVWVANRAEFGVSPPGSGIPRGSIARIGLILGGTRVDSGGNPDPLGDFLAPPFQYSTCKDRNLDGFIKTSRGLGSILPWNNAGGADSHGGVSTAEDECILNYTRVTGTGTRTLAVDSNNDVWVGGLGNQAHEKIDGVTGQPIPGTQFDLNCGGYGGLLDCGGVLWSARHLLRFDPELPPPPGQGICLAAAVPGSYGLGLDPTTGRVWVSELGGSNQVHELNFDGTVRRTFPQGFGAQGLAVDTLGHVWVAEIFGSRVLHLAPDPLNPGEHVVVGYVNGFLGTTGVAVDLNGKVWATEINGNSVARIDPSAGPPGTAGIPVGAIDLRVDLGPGAGPYNYSDMTGSVVLSNPPFGSWSVVEDTECEGGQWGTISWSSLEPAGTRLKVEFRAAASEAGLAAEPFLEVSNGVPFGPLAGRFTEIRVSFLADPDATCEFRTPILYELTVDGPGYHPETSFLDCPEDVTAECDTVPPAPSPTAVNTCGQTPEVSFEELEAAGSCGGTFDLIRRWTAGDAVCEQVVHAVDTQGPILTQQPTFGSFPGGCAFLWPPQHGYVQLGVGDARIAAVDACGEPVRFEAVACGSSQPENNAGGKNSKDGGDGESLCDCAFSPDLQRVALRAERNGSCSPLGRTYGVAFDAVDACGNRTRSAPATVCVPHDQGHPPTDAGPVYKANPGSNQKDDLCLAASWSNGTYPAPSPQGGAPVCGAGCSQACALPPIR